MTTIFVLMFETGKEDFTMNESHLTVSLVGGEGSTELMYRQPTSGVRE